VSVNVFCSSQSLILLVPLASSAIVLVVIYATIGAIGMVLVSLTIHHSLFVLNNNVNQNMFHQILEFG
jgi:hypothetical protein